MFWKNIKTDYGAKGDGTTNDDAAFLSFNAWAITQTATVILYIPPGTYVLTRTLLGGARGGGDFYRGIKNLIIWGWGATLTNFVRIDPFYSQDNSGNPTPGALAVTYINLATAGSTTVTATAAWAAGTYNVGDWVMVASLETQGTGQPPSHYYIDFKQIASTNSPTNTQMTFTDPLTYTHLATYPNTSNPANPAGSLQTGGPAAIFQISQDWNQEVQVYGLSFIQSGGNTEWQLCCRRGTMIDCSSPGASATTSGVYPSVCQEFVAERCDFGGYFEPDKEFGVIRLIQCRAGQMNFSSMSWMKLVVDGCIITNKCTGFSKNSYFINCNIASMSPQTMAAAMPTSCIIDNCTIGVWTSWSASNSSIALSSLTFTNGRFFIPISAGYNTYSLIFNKVIPGAIMFFSQTGSPLNFGNAFMVMAIGNDGTNIWFDTTLKAMPTYTGGLGAPNCITVHPCPRFSSRSVDGDQQALQFSKGTAESPLYSYIHKVYSSDLVFTTNQSLLAWGTLVSLTINVIVADTGTNATLTMNPCAHFGAWYVPATNAQAQLNPVVDLKTAGKRVITPTAVTGSAGADVLGAAPGAIWFMGTASSGYTINPYLSVPITTTTNATAATFPVVEIELITDQGITKLPYNALAHA